MWAKNAYYDWEPDLCISNYFFPLLGTKVITILLVIVVGGIALIKIKDFMLRCIDKYWNERLNL